MRAALYPFRQGDYAINELAFLGVNGCPDSRQFAEKSRGLKAVEDCVTVWIDIARANRSGQIEAF
jgi:hypothetical protein